MHFSLLCLCTAFALVVGFSTADFPDHFHKVGHPIVTPKTGTFYSAGAYNPTVAWHNGLVYMIFRASNGSKSCTGTLGLAWSNDGLHFTVHSEPIVVPQHQYEKGGVEDPRLVRISSTFYLTYVCNDNMYNQSHICLATSTNLFNWTKHGVLLQRTQNSWDRGNRKAAVIIPTPLATGSYAMYFLGEHIPWETCIGVAFSKDPDLLTWEEHPKPLLCGRGGSYFDAKGVEPGTGLMLPEGNVLLIYNGWNEAHVHCVAMAQFSSKDGTTLLQRSSVPLIHPTEEWEMKGVTPNITFGEGVLFNTLSIANWAIYYGAADERVGVAFGETRRLFRKKRWKFA